MFPNLVCVRRRGKRCEFKTHEDGKVDLHPSSVNARFGQTFPFSWLAYREKVKTTGVYIRDSTCVPAPSSTRRRARGGRRRRERQDLRRRVRLLRLGVDGWTGATITTSTRRRPRRESARPGVGRHRRGAPSLTPFARSSRKRRRRRRRRWRSGRGGVRRTRERARSPRTVRRRRRRSRGRFHRGGRGRAGFRGGGGREGDWACPRGCGMVFASKPVCFRCGTPRP